MKIAIIMNVDRTSEDLIAKLKSNELGIKYNISYDLHLTKPKELESVLRELNHETYNGYVIGGGDGTVRTAVQVLIDHETEIPIAILPLGTFNMLAKELDHPNDIEKLFEIIKNNKTKLIDLAQVNKTVVINHAWIGFYYYILKLRKKHKNILGTNKLLKAFFNFYSLFKVFPIYNLQIKTDNETLQYKTCLVYVGNNASYTNALDFGDRKSLTSGLLDITILNCQNRWQLFLCIWNLLFHDIKNSKYISHFTNDNLTIDVKSDVINTVVDGELFKLNTPLIFTVLKKRLKVFTK